MGPDVCLWEVAVVLDEVQGFDMDEVGRNLVVSPFLGEVLKRIKTSFEVAHETQRLLTWRTARIALAAEHGHVELEYSTIVSNEEERMALPFEYPQGRPAVHF